MKLQTLNSINIRKLKCFSGDYRFKLATMLATQYKLHHNIWYVLVNKSGTRPYVKKRTDHRHSTKQVLCKM